MPCRSSSSRKRPTAKQGRPPRAPLGGKSGQVGYNRQAPSNPVPYAHPIATFLWRHPLIFSTDLNQITLVSPAAAAFIAEHDLVALACGRYDLGNGDFVNVMEYTTKLRQDACYEAHRDYVDIQVVIRGAEQIEVAPIDALEVTSPYDADGDCVLYSGAHGGERFLMTPGRGAS